MRGMQGETGREMAKSSEVSEKFLFLNDSFKNRWGITES